MRCPVCQEETEQSTTGYCHGHGQAFTNLRKAYAQWTIGYGSISLLDFLKRISKLAETGEKAREVARYVIQDPSRWG